MINALQALGILIPTGNDLALTNMVGYFLENLTRKASCSPHSPPKTLAGGLRTAVPAHAQQCRLPRLSSARQPVARRPVPVAIRGMHRPHRLQQQTSRHPTCPRPGQPPTAAAGPQAERNETISAIGEDLFAVAVDQPFRFPAAFTFVLRAFSTLEGLGKGLDPDYSFPQLAQPFGQRLLDLQARCLSVQSWPVMLPGCKLCTQQMQLVAPAVPSRGCAACPAGPLSSTCCAAGPDGQAGLCGRGAQAQRDRGGPGHGQPAAARAAHQQHHQPPGGWHPQAARARA